MFELGISVRLKEISGPLMTVPFCCPWLGGLWAREAKGPNLGTMGYFCVLWSLPPLSLGSFGV